MNGEREFTGAAIGSSRPGRITTATEAQMAGVSSANLGETTMTESSIDAFFNVIDKWSQRFAWAVILTAAVYFFPIFVMRML